MARLKQNFAYGTLSASLTSSATTVTSAAFASLPAVASPDTLTLILDPDGTAGTPEIVWVTAHTAASTSVTVSRGQETAAGGSTGRSHANGTAWRHDGTAADFAFTSAEVGYAETTSAFTTTSGTYVDVTGLTVTAVCDGSPVEVVAYLPAVDNDTAGQACAVQLLEDGAAVRTQVVEVSATTNEKHAITIWHRTVPAAGSHTWKVQAARAFGGSGTVTITSAAANSSWLWARKV